MDASETKWMQIYVYIKPLYSIKFIYLLTFMMIVYIYFSDNPIKKVYICILNVGNYNIYEHIKNICDLN